MTAIGLDLGDKRVGISIEREGIAFPFSIVPRTKIIDEIKKIVVKENIKTLVVGLPYDLYGIKTKQLEKTQGFIQKLESLFPDLDVVGVDERFTTFEAEDVVKKMGKGGQKKDDIAAMLILETYLDSKK